MPASRPLPAFQSADATDRLVLERVQDTRSALVPAFATLSLAGTLAWSAHAPADPATYWIWTTPVLLCCALLVATRRRLPLSSLSLLLFTLLGAFLMLAGAGVDPTGSAQPRLAGLTLTGGALAQLRAFLIGATSVVLCRELLLRKSPLLPGRWLAFLSVTVGLAIFQALGFLGWSAGALLQRPAPPAAGVVESLLVYAGAASSLLFFTRLHDRQIAFLWMDFTESLDWCVVHGAGGPRRVA